MGQAGERERTPSGSMEGGAEAAAPVPGLSTVYCGAYRDNQDCGFGLRGAELARCYEVSFHPHAATYTPARPSPCAFASGQLDRGRVSHATGARSWAATSRSGAPLTQGRAQGEYVDGKRSGEGIFRYPNAFYRYEGPYVDGRKHGRGRLVLGDGGFYEGEFCEDEITGSGERAWSDGRRYRGEFLEGEMHGFGEHTFPSGEKYTGQFSDNLREGEGTLGFAQGGLYEGAFSRNKFHGKGRLITRDGDEFNGEFEKGKFTGSGSIHWSNGSTYEGATVNGCKEGEGTYYDADTGITFAGQFRNDKAIGLPFRLSAAWDKEDPDDPLLCVAGSAAPRIRILFERKVALEAPPQDDSTSTPTVLNHLEEDMQVKWQVVESESGRKVSASLHKGGLQTTAEGGESLGEVHPFSTGADGGEVRRITERSLNGVALYTTLRVGKDTEPGDYTLRFQAPGLEGCNVTVRVEAPEDNAAE